MIYPGATLNNRYRLDKKIGEGGFSNVYQATDLLLGRLVAVKVLDASLEGNVEFLDRFQREARSVAILDHPYILTIHDFGLLDNSAYLVMPYVSGGPLSARMRASRLTLDEVAYFLEQISSALDYAHRYGIVHRDVKPQNVLLRSDGRAVLTDFGFAKQLANAQVEAKTVVLGTVHYMAPEQFRGLVSAASDQYSLGILLYQMIANVLPFGGSPQEMILGHIQQTPPNLSQQPTMQDINPEITARLDPVLAKVLSKTPATRYPNCETLYNAYRGAIQTKFHSGAPIPVAEEDDHTEVDLGRLPRIPANLRQSPPFVPVVQPPVAPPVSSGGPVAQPVVPVTSGPQPVAESEKPTELYNPAISRQNVMPSGAPPVSQNQAPVLLEPAHLKIRSEPDQHVNLDFKLTEETITLGRELSNTLQIPLSTVSRHHATLHRVGLVGPGMKYRIVDNKSRNQLSFKGQLVTDKVLEDGDVIEIGKLGYGDYVVYLTYTAPVFSTGLNPNQPKDEAGTMMGNPARPNRPY